MTDETASGEGLARRVASGVAAEGSEHLRIVDEQPVGEVTEDGVCTYALDCDGTRIASVYVYPDRIRIEVSVNPDVAMDAGASAGLRVRPKAVQPPRALVFVESGAQVAPALDVVEAVCDSVE